MTSLVFCRECRKRLADGDTLVYCNELCELQYQQRMDDLRKEILKEVREGQHPGYYYRTFAVEKMRQNKAFVDILSDGAKIKSKL